MTEKSFPTTILVGTDGSNPARKAIRVAAEIAKMSGSKAHLCNVTLVSPYIYPDTLSEQQFERLRQASRERLQNESDYAHTLGLDFEKTHMRFGRPDVEMLSVAEEIGAGLIVIGNKSGQALARMLLGNDAESIVRNAPCDVLVARS